jgi:hypothetical protein
LDCFEKPQPEVDSIPPAINVRKWCMNLKSMLKEAWDMAENQPELSEQEELAEGYPDFKKVLSAISQIQDLPEAGVRRVEVNTFASGDATYNMWVVGADEAIGGYLESV